MKATTLKLTLTHWPYGLEVHPIAKGLLLRPRRKARASWDKSFSRPQKLADELKPVCQLPNRFDSEEWAW